MQTQCVSQAAEKVVTQAMPTHVLRLQLNPQHTPDNGENFFCIDLSNQLTTITINSLDSKL
jgi:hypothetical protein